MDRQSPTRRQHSGDTALIPAGRTRRPKRALSRRKIFARAVGVAAVGAAGGSVLTEATASPAKAAGRTVVAGQSTIVEQGAVAPAVVTLTDAATIAVDASLGNDFRVTIAANRTMGNPSNPADGQKITFQVTQGAAGSSTITWGSGYEFSAGLPQPTLSTTAGQTDLLGFIYNAAKGKWLLAAFVNGFSHDGRRPAARAPTGCSRPRAGRPARFPIPGRSWPAWCSRSPRAALVRRLLVVGVPVRAVHVGAEVRAVGRVQPRDRGADPGGHGYSGPLTAGQWNYVPLATPVPLAIGACYNACTGFSW